MLRSQSCLFRHHHTLTVHHRSSCSTSSLLRARQQAQTLCCGHCARPEPSRTTGNGSSPPRAHSLAQREWQTCEHIAAVNAGKPASPSVFFCEPLRIARAPRCRLTRPSLLHLTLRTCSKTREFTSTLWGKVGRRAPVVSQSVSNLFLEPHICCHPCGVSE